MLNEAGGLFYSELLIFSVPFVSLAFSGWMLKTANVLILEGVRQLYIFNASYS